MNHMEARDLSFEIFDSVLRRNVIIADLWCRDGEPIAFFEFDMAIYKSK